MHLNVGNMLNGGLRCALMLTYSCACKFQEMVDIHELKLLFKDVVYDDAYWQRQVVRF